jgi:propionate CoA-transferase
MDFRPIMTEPPRLMDARIFRPEPMDLRTELLAPPMEQRFAYDSRTNRFFVNLEGFAVRSQADIDNIQHYVESKLAPLGKPVFGFHRTRFSGDIRLSSTAGSPHVERN